MGSKKLAVKAYRPEIKQLTSIVTIILENALKEWWIRWFLEPKRVISNKLFHIFHMIEKPKYPLKIWG